MRFGCILMAEAHKVAIFCVCFVLKFLTFYDSVMNENGRERETMEVEVLKGGFCRVADRRQEN